MLNIKIYQNLLAQFHRIFKHNRQGSIKTRHRYKAAFERFLAFLAEFFQLQKITNISPKHIYAYANHLIERGGSIAYIKLELAAIRFWHDKISEPRYNKLPTNEQLDLAKRQYGGIDRTWSLLEFDRMVDKAAQLSHDMYVDILLIARYQAFRIEECFKLDTAMAHKAIKTDAITIRGKGGLFREAPLHPGVRVIFEKRLKVTPRGSKLFVPPELKTHEAMKRLQNFIGDHRKNVQDANSTRPMTFHGLRHLRATEWYEEFLAAGLTEKQARLKISRLLGHGRDSVAKLYLTSLD